MVFVCAILFLKQRYICSELEHYNSLDKSLKNTLVYNLNSRALNESVGVLPVFICIHKAGDTFGMYDGYYNNCKEMYLFDFKIDANKNIIAYLSYRYINQSFSIELTASEQREFYQKLLNDGFFELPNLIREWKFNTH